MKMDYEITFLIDGQQVGSSYLTVENGELDEQAATEQFFAVLRKNKARLIANTTVEEND